MEEIVQKIHINNELFSIIAFVFCSLMLIRILHRAHRDSIVDWSDLITINGPSNKVSFPKLIQLIAMVTATWIVIHMTIFGKLTYDIFAVYLAYSGGNEAFSKYLALKKEVALQQK